MKYKNIVKGIFISRPNRFIANVRLSTKTVEVHVKNTGRCREILVPGAVVILEKSDNSLRRTEYDLISVYKGSRLINIDSQAPNKVAGEFLTSFFKEIIYIKPETVYKNSRFDFFVKSEMDEIYVEVKGVTLEKDNRALFPDAPTTRGVKHLNELSAAVAEGYRAMVIFLVQMEGVSEFSPNEITHQDFGRALRAAKEQGVEVIAMDCKVTEDSIEINNPVKIDLYFSSLPAVQEESL